MRLRQDARGHRVGTDAILLAAATPREANGLILDIGAGVGAVGLSAAVLAPAATIGLVEIDPGSCALARENIVLNGFEERARVFEADLLVPRSRFEAGLANESAEIVLTNPPYLTPGRARISPDAGKALAHVGVAGLAPWTRACISLLRPGGSFVMIHRADALEECLASLQARVGAITILPVASRTGAPANRIVLRGVKGSKAPLTLAAPLSLHKSDGKFTPEAEAIHRGEQKLPW